MARARGVPVLPPGPRGPRRVNPPGRPGLAVALTLSGHSQASIARELGVHRDTVSQMVRGVMTPGTDLQHRMADLLGVHHVTALFELADSTTPDVDRVVLTTVAGIGHISPPSNQPSIWDT